MAAYNLSLEDLRTAIAAANVDQAKGTLNGSRQTYTIGANDQLVSSSDYKPVVIAYRNGAPVRASDVATDCGCRGEQPAGSLDGPHARRSS